MKETRSVPSQVGRVFDHRDQDTLIMFRIWPVLWETEEGLRRLMDYFRDSSRAVDELALYSFATLAPPPLDEARRQANRWQSVMAQLRAELGLRVGFNVPATMGHRPENLDGSMNEPWQRVVGADGQQCPGSYCPNDPHFQEFAREFYTIHAASKPDFIWIDDDIRLGHHHPVSFVCFCDRCVADFSRRVGERFTRQTLRAALDVPSQDATDSIRHQWLEHNRRLIAELLRVIEQAVHAIAPGLPIGFMACDRFWEGYDFPRWAEALAGPDRSEVRWRPGGGFWSDDVPLELVTKAHEVGRQTAVLPKEVAVIQSEVETFPHYILKKSVRMTILEAAAYLAAGATGTAFNVLTHHREPLDEYRPFLAAVKLARPFLAAMRERLGRRLAIGVFPAWNRDLFVASGSRESWLESPMIVTALRQQYVFGEIGLPMCYHRDGARVITLAGATPLAFNNDELQEMFRGGVFLDVAAWRALDQRGLSHLTGVRPAIAIERDAIEVFREHPINEGRTGRQRNCRQAYWPEVVHRLEAAADKVEVLADLTDYEGRQLGPCLTAHENPLGGRVAVAGYYPWFLIHNESKSIQLKRLFLWLSRDTLPVVVESCAKTIVWAHGELDGEIAFALLNASFDAVANLCLRVRSRASRFDHLTLDGQREFVDTEFCADLPADYGRLVLQNVSPWSVHLLAPHHDNRKTTL